VLLRQIGGFYVAIVAKITYTCNNCVQRILKQIHGSDSKPIRVTQNRYISKPVASPPAFPSPPVNHCWLIRYSVRLRSAQHLHFLSYPIAREPNPADCKRRNWFTAARSIGMVNSTTPVDGRPGRPIRSLVARWRRRPSESHVYYLHNWRKIGCHGNVPRGIEKGNFRSFIYTTFSSSTIPASSVKIGLVDVKIIGLTGITKNKY